MPSFILPSFAKGEISPQTYGRVDTAMYRVALRTARNLIIHATGGASNRPGTVFICPVKTHSESPRVFDFQYRTTDQYVLIFGGQYMWVVRNDALVTNTTINITAVTQGNPVVVTAGSHGFSNGDAVFTTGVSGMTQLNDNFYIVQNVATNTMELTHQVTGNNIDGTRFEPYVSGGTVGSIFELSTPYLAADLDELKMVQSADTMTITHPSYAPRDLTRTGHASWTLTVNTYAPGQADPAGVAVAQQGTSGSTTHRYKVTAIRREENVFEESLSGLSNTTVTLSSATLTNPVRCVVASDVFVTGDEVEVSAMDEMTALNGRRFFVTRIDATHIDLDDEDGTDTAVYPTAETTGGLANATFVELTDSITVALTVLANFNRVSWTAASGAGRYAIYRRESGMYGLIAEVDAPATSFDDVTTGVTAAGAIHAVDLDVSPPRARNPFLLSGTFPGTSTYYQQRQMYGGSLNAPDTWYASQTGNRLNMSVSIPLQADDAMTVTLTARQVNEIRHFVPLSDLLIFTSGSEWRVNSGESSGFSVETLRQKPQSEWGSSHQRPIVVGETILFVEDGGARVRGFGFSLEPDKYISSDLTQLAGHLFAEEGPNEYVVADWAHASVPESRLYVVRTDGQVLTMTFDKSQQVIAWTHWDTDGEYERVTSLKRSVSGVEDGVYFVVKRSIAVAPGSSILSTVRYVERLATRKFSDVRDVHFVDSGLVLDSPTAITASTAADPVVLTAASHGISNDDLVDVEGIVWTSSFDEHGNETQPDQLNDQRFVAIDVTTDTLQIVEERGSVIAGATTANPVVVTSQAHGFSDGNVVYISGVAGMTDLNGSTYTVAGATDDTFELEDVNGEGFGAWTAGGLARLRVDGTSYDAYVSDGNVREAVTVLTGIEHLEGEDVAILADGSPLPSVPLAEATASNPTTVVVNGSVTIRTPASRVHLGLGYVSDLETLNIEAGQATIQGKLGKISEVVTRFYKSRLPLVGPDSSSMVRMKQREDEEMGAPIDLLTSDKKVKILPDWNSNGRVFYRQDQPVPTTWLAIIPDLEVEDREGGKEL